MVTRAGTWALVGLLVASSTWGQVGVQDDPERLVVRSESLTVVLSKAQRGAIASLVDHASQRELAAAQAEPCLFRLGFTKVGDPSGTTEEFTSRDAAGVDYAVERTVEGETAVVLFHAIGGRSIEVRCSASVKQGDGLVRWRIAVSGSEPLILEEIQFPILVLTDTLGTDRADDVALAGATEDGQYLAPGDWRVGQRHVYTQPGSLAAQFACFYDPAVGFFTATQDGAGYPKQLTVARLVDGLGFTWSHLSHHELRAPFALAYEVVCTTFRGKDEAVPTDWRDAADIHKAWAVTQPWCARTVVQRQDIPDWIKRGCVRVQWELRADGKPEAATDWLARYWERYLAPLPPFVTFFGFEHVASWVAPKYVPFYPSDEAFQEATRRIREMDGHVLLFPSGYHWSLTYNRLADGSFTWDDRVDFAATGRPHAMLNRDGSAFTKGHSWLLGGETAALCRGDAWSRQFLTDTVAQLVERGVDAVQMDQVVGGRWPADGKTVCFSKDHGHPPGHGLWDVAAYHEQMQALRELGDKTNPPVVFSQESPQELFVQEFGLFDYRHDRANLNVKVWDLAPKKHAPVFPYLYHEFVPVFHIPSHSEPVPIILAHAIVSGEIPSFKPGQIQFPGDPVVENGSFESWSDGPPGWRIWRNRPQGPATAAPDAEEVRAGKSSLRFTGEEEGENIQVYQCIPVDGTVVRIGGTYRLRLAMKSAGLGDTGGVVVEALDSPDWQVWKRLNTGKADAPADGDWQESSVSFTVPEGSQILRLILLLNGRGKIWFDDLRLEEIQGDGTASERVRQGNTVFRLVQQWTRLAAAGAGKYLIQGTMLHPPPLQTGTTQVTVSANKAASLSFQMYALKPDHSTSVAHASCPLTIAAGEGPWEQKSLEITIAPGAGELHIPLSLRQKGEILFDDFALTEVGGTLNLLRNADFEDWADPAAVPPGWTHIADYQGRTFTGTFHREEQDTHAGAYALRLVNTSDSDAVHVKQVLPVDGALLAVGKTYRVSFWVKVRNVARWQPVRVEHEFPAILHNAFRAPDGSSAVILLNITDQHQVGRLTWGGTATELKLTPWEIRLVTP